jgi:hypothetical protein
MLTEDVRQHKPNSSLHSSERWSQLKGKLLKSSSPVRYYSDPTKSVYGYLPQDALFILIEHMLQLSSTLHWVAILWGDQQLVARVHINQLQLADLEDGTI